MEKLDIDIHIQAVESKSSTITGLNCLLCTFTQIQSTDHPKETLMDDVLILKSHVPQKPV